MRLDTLGEKGFALPLVIMITTIIMLLGTAFLTLAGTEESIAQNQVAQTQALFIADAGVEKALHVLDKKPLDKSVTEWMSENQGELANIAVGGGTANVSIQDKGSLIEITSQGQKGNAVKTLIAKAAPPAFEFGLAGGNGSSTLEFTGNGNIEADIAYDGNVSIGSNSRTVTAHKVVVTGDFTVNGTLEAEHESADPPVDILHVGGKVSAGKDNDIQGNWQYDVGGSISPVGAIEGVAADLGEPYVPPPPDVDLSWYFQHKDLSAADPNDAAVVAKLATEPSGPEILYFSGNLTIQSQHGHDPIEFKGVRVLVVDGDVEVKDKLVPFDDDGDGKDDDGNALLILATGNVDLTPAGGADKSRNLIVISEGMITMSGNVDVEGAVWGATINSNGCAEFEYDEDMVELIRDTGLVKEYSYRLVSWQEQ